MATMEAFDTILNWKLQRGSHKFPVQTEEPASTKRPLLRLASLPAGRSAYDMPACFSRPICTLALYLNDWSSDEERQHLLPFVARLACADTAEVEQQREAYIALRIRYRLPFREGLQILEGALAIGRQADGLAPEEVTTRLESVRQSATPRHQRPPLPISPRSKRGSTLLLEFNAEGVGQVILPL
jgi:hypothetical protein